MQMYSSEATHVVRPRARIAARQADCVALGIAIAR